MMNEMMNELKVKELGRLVEFSEMDESAWDYIEDFDLDADFDYTEDVDGDFEDFEEDYLDIIADEEFQDLFNAFYG